MKIRITESFEKIKKALKDSGYFAIGKVDETGFILPDGDFLNTADNTYGHQWHNDVESFLRENGLENAEAEEISANNDSGDGSPTLEAFGAIRVSSGESYICLPPVRPTEQAFATLDKWLDNYISVWDFSDRTPWIYVCNYEGDVDNEYDPTDDDVVKKIKRYYSSGRLVESLTESKEDQQRFLDWIYNGLILNGVGESSAKTRAKELYDEFMSHKQSLKSPENDIYYWMKKDAFWDFVNGFMVDLEKKDKEKKRKSKSESEGARLIYKDDDWLVYEITTYEASVKYGKGTKWCISGSERWGNGEDGKDYWNRYALNGVRFFFFIDRKSNDKYALAIYPDHEHYEIFNSADLAVPAIPGAPLVRELLDMMGRHDAFYTVIDPEREIELSIAKGKADFDFIKPYLDNCDFNYHDDGSLTLVNGARDFVDMLDMNIPDEYLEWEATSSGLMTKDEYRRLTGYDFDDESEWAGDLPLVQNWEELPGWENGKRYIMSPNRYDDDAYYLFLSDGYDGRWSEHKTLQDALLEMSRYSSHIISEIANKITTDIMKGDVSVDEVAQAFDLSDDAIEQLKSISGKRESLNESEKRGLRGMNDDNINETMNEISEKIEKHEELNQKLFEGDKLKEDVRDKILEIADEFVKGLKEDEIKFDVKDVVLVGSNVSYNYTEDSDLDIHIIADSTNLDCPDELYPLLYSAYRSLFNKDYDITIKGIPAEIYVEIDEPQGKSNGVYSVKNDDWIKKPEIENIPDIDEEAFDREFEKWENRYFELKDEIESELVKTEHPLDESLLRESKQDIQRFIDKFGDELYQLFVNSKDRLKNAGKTTDMNFYTKNVEVEELRKLLYGLRAKTGSVDDEESQGERRYLGSANGYDVYEPLDVESSMALGVGTGWCTTGRYGHAGELNFKPSLKDAEEHWNAYTKKGIRFFYFLQDGVGKYALALYPKVLNVNKKVSSNTILKRTNFELFDQYDKLDYKDLDKLPLNLIKDEIVIEKKDTSADATEIKLKSGKEAYLVVYNRNPLVVGWEAPRAPKTTWKNLQQTIIKWYDDEFPDELKEQYPREVLHSLCVENLVSGKNIPDWVEPISDESRAFRLEYFPNVLWKNACIERQYYDWYWLENEYSDDPDDACSVDGDRGDINFDYSGWDDGNVVRPAFFLNRKPTDK